MKKLVLIGCMMIMASSCFAYPSAGQTAPGFTLPDTNGVNHPLSEFLGKVVWLNFWSST
ncbi:MAG: redoxin domain-containing protein [bacterium]|nr:redoxin domain-containing protein [bacterium]